MEDLDYPLKKFLDQNDTDLRKFVRLGEIEGKTEAPPSDADSLSATEKLIISEADSLWTRFKNSVTDELNKIENSINKIKAEIEQEISVTLDKISDEKVNELDLLEAEFGTYTSEYGNLKSNFEKTENEVTEIRGLLNRPLQTNFVNGYIIFMLCLAFAEVPVNRLAFELFFEQSPIISLLLAGAVGILFVLFAHIIGSQIRHTQCKELNPEVGKVYISLGGLILMSMLVMYFLGVMREQLVAVQNSANLNLEDMLNDDTQAAVSSGLSSLAIGSKGLMLLLLNLSIYVSGIIMAFLRHDPHPRYERAIMAYERAKSSFLKYQKNYENKQVEKLREFNQKHSFNKALQREREASIESITRSRETLRTIKDVSREKLISAVSLRINAFREANAGSRKTKPPGYFKDSPIVYLEARIK